MGDDILVNTMENGNTFPNPNSVGFAANTGDSATFTDYKIENGGKYTTGTLLDAETGATYSIFNGMDGVAVDGNTITVNGGDTGILGYADPSYAAAPMVRTDFEAKSEIESARLYRLHRVSTISISTDRKLRRKNGLTQAPQSMILFLRTIPMT